jgi:hypothetical protein
MTVLAPQDTLSPIEWLAIQTLGKHADNFRAGVNPGKGIDVDFLVRVQGKLDVSPNGATTTNKHAGPDAVAVLAHVFKRLPQETADTIRHAIKAAYDADNNVHIEEGFLEAAKIFMGTMTKTTSTTGPRKGAVKGAFQIGRLELEQLSSRVQNTIKAATRAINFGDEEE